jgi:hypothetical protein
MFWIWVLNICNSYWSIFKLFAIDGQQMPIHKPYICYPGKWTNTQICYENFLVIHSCPYRYNSEQLEKFIITIVLIKMAPHVVTFTPFRLRNHDAILVFSPLFSPGLWHHSLFLTGNFPGNQITSYKSMITWGGASIISVACPIIITIGFNTQMIIFLIGKMDVMPPSFIK